MKEIDNNISEDIWDILDEIYIKEIEIVDINMEGFE